MPYKSKAEQAAYQLAWTLQRRQEWVDANGPCVQCGSSDDLQVDHVDPATKISHRIWTWSVIRREAELAKCQVLCQPCHQAKTTLEITTLPPHGTYARYSRHDENRCRCTDCRRAAADYEWKRRRNLSCASTI